MRKSKHRHRPINMVLVLSTDFQSSWATKGFHQNTKNTATLTAACPSNETPPAREYSFFGRADTRSWRRILSHSRVIIAWPVVASNGRQSSFKGMPSTAGVLASDEDVGVGCTTFTMDRVCRVRGLSFWFLCPYAPFAKCKRDCSCRCCRLS